MTTSHVIVSEKSSIDAGEREEFRLNQFNDISFKSYKCEVTESFFNYVLNYIIELQNTEK
jgi:hypothetical protein